MKLTRWTMAAALALTLGGFSFAADKPADEKPKITEGSCCDKAKKAGKECAHPCCVKAAEKGEVCTKCNKQAGETKDAK